MEEVQHETGSEEKVRSCDSDDKEKRVLRELQRWHENVDKRITGKERCGQDQKPLKKRDLNGPEHADGYIDGK